MSTEDESDEPVEPWEDEVDRALAAAHADLAADLATVLNLEAGLQAIIGRQGDAPPAEQA